MKQIRVLAQYYVDLMVKLGLVRFSLLLASALVVLAMVVQMAVTMLLRGEVESIDVVRSIFFGLLITPWAVYFLSVVVEQLEESRQRLARLVDKLEEMRHRDLELNQQLKDNISQLNQEIADRIKAEEERLQVMEKLTEEMEQRELAQIELGQQSALLRSFLDASPDLVYYRNEDKEFSGCNRAMELLTGKSEKQLIGLTPFDVYGREIAEKVIETDEKVFRHNVSLTYEQWLVYPDGRKACFELRKVPFYDQVGKRHGLMGFGRDITERKRYQDALENASREKTTFISTISHELRTPLNGIVGLSRILLDTELNDEQLKYLKTIHVSAITLGNIFNDIIEMDKLERRKVQLDNQPVDFTGFLADLENLSGLLAQPKGLQFIMEPQTPLPQQIVTDGTRLRQILWNLIGNAVKFTSRANRGARAARGAGGKAGVRGGRLGHGHPAGRAGQDLRHVLPGERSARRPSGHRHRHRAGGLQATGAEHGRRHHRAQRTGARFLLHSDHPGAGGAGSRQRGAGGRGTAVAGAAHPAGGGYRAERDRGALGAGETGQQRRGGDERPRRAGDVRSGRVRFGAAGHPAAGHDRAGHRPGAARTLRRAGAAAAGGPDRQRAERQKEYLEAGMDDVLSKPLSVPALTQVIKHYWDHQPSHTSKKTEHKAMQINESLLDTAMLEQYMDLVGPQLIHQSLEMFEQMMPGYLAVLDSNMTARDQKGITEEGHKIKGAAGSVGLRHLQQLAQQIQTPTLPAWWDNVQDWVDELKQEWRNDVQVLRAWVENAENDPDLSRGARILRQHQGNCEPAYWFQCSGRAGCSEFLNIIQPTT